MANKIGIVLALDGEKEFTNGMKAAQQSAKLFDQNLKNLESEYKGNANSLEALTKKQEQLTNKQKAYNRELESAKSGQKNAIDNYKKAGERLEELKDDLDKAKQAMKAMEDAGDNSSAAYKKQAKAVEDLEKAVGKQAQEHAKASTNITKWDTAVAKAEGDVRQANTAVEKNAKYLDEAAHSADGCAKSIDRMGKEASEAGDEMNQMSIGLKDMIKAKAVDLAGDAVRELGQKAIEAAKYVVEVGSQFEASMSKVQALSGASAEEMEAMSQKAQELGSSTRFSASEVADGFSYMALAGWDAGQSIAAIEGIVNLAAASEMDLAQASDMVTDYLSAFGMEASRAGEMADMMAYAQANSNTTTQQLGDAFGNCAANMNAAGQDMKTTTSFLEAFANQGIKGSEAGTKLSAIMRDITAKMQDGKIMIGDTAVAVTDANGNFRDLTDIMIDVEAATEGMGTAERSAALAATFTSRSVGGLNMILAEGMDNIAGYETALENCDGAASEMAGTMQNNLQGAITEMNSAAEGLGIALYDKVKGPLTDAVRLATDLLSGITDAITPEKTALDEFIDSVKQANSETQVAIDNANTTMNKAEADVSRIDTMAETIKAANEQFGLFAEVDTSVVAMDMETTASGVAESASSIEESATLVKDSMSMDDVDTSAASDNLSDTESSISESAAAIGDDAQTAVDGLNKVNDADTSGAAENVEATAGSIKTSADGIGSDADAIKSKIESIGEADLSAGNLKAELDTMRGSMTDASASMDEFTKFKVKAAVMDLAQSIPAIGEAWDDVTGTLQMTEQEFDNLINAQKRAIMESALAKAQADSMEAVAKATISQTMAQDALTAVYEQANAALKEYGYEEQANIQTSDDLRRAWEEHPSILSDLKDAEKDASKALEEANGNCEEAVDVQERTQAATEKLAKSYGLAADASEQVADSTQTVVEATEEQIEAEQAAAEAAYKAQAQIAEIHRQTAQEIVDAYEQAKQAAENAFNVNPFDEWSQNAENGIAKMQAAFDSQLEGMANYADNLQAVSEHVGQEITPEFLQYLENMGTEGAQVMQELADAFANGDTATVEQLMDSYVKAMDKQDEIASAIAADAVAFKLGLNEFASSAEEWQGIDSAIEYIQQTGGQVSEATMTAFEEAEQTARECGVKIPDGLKEGIESGSSDPEAAVQAATDKINAAIQGRAEGLLEVARQAGIPIPDGIAEGIAQGGDSCVEAYQQLISSLSSSSVDITPATEAGGEIVSGVASGMEDSAGEAEGAAQAVVEAANESAKAAATGFNTAGNAAVAGFRVGISTQQGLATSTATSLAQAAANAARNAASEFNAAGANAGSNFASGVNGQAGAAYSAGANLAASGRDGASGDDWTDIGSNLAAGIAAGIQSQVQAVANAAASLVRTTKKAAKTEAEIESPSKVWRREIGQMLGAGAALGISDSTEEVASAAEAQMNQTLLRIKKWLTKNKSALAKSGQAYSDSITAAWLHGGNQLALNNFGIAPTKTTGSGDKAKTEKKTATEYYGEIFSAASKYLNNVKTLYNVEAADEVTYWQGVRKRLKQGTQAWYDASKAIKDAQKKVKDEQKQAAEDAAQKAAEANTKIYTKAEQHVIDMQNLNKMSVKDELAYWNSIIGQLKKGSDEYERVEQRIKEAKAKFGTLEAADTLLDNYQVYYEMSARAEMQYWDEVRKHYKTGTAGRIKADKLYLEARKNYKEQMLDAENEKNEAILSANEKLNEKLLDIAGIKDDKIINKEQARAAAVKKINDKLNDDIKKRNEKLTDDIANAIESRTSQIANAFNLFAEFDSTSATGEQLLFNLKSQAEGYKDWAEQLEKLEKRGILSKDLMQELRESGPQNSAAIHALNMLSDSDLKEYNKAYLDKMEVSAKEAAKDTTDAVAELRASASKDIEELKKTASDDIKQVDEDIKKAVAENAKAVKEAESAYKTAVADASKGISDDLLGLAKNIENIATDMTSALVAAFESKEGQKAGAAKSVGSNVSAKTVSASSAGSVVQAATSGTVAAAPTKAKSTRETLLDIINSGKSRSKNITAKEMDTHSMLWMYLVSKYGRQVTEAMIKKLAKALGISTSKSTTDIEKSRIYTALTKQGLASGTRRLRDPFAWMDEQGIGSEMIIRKSDGARLNTNVQTGDAIVPAANTDNLWKWSQLNPNAVMPRTMSEASMNAYALSKQAQMEQARAETAMAGMMSGMLEIMQTYMPYMAQRQRVTIGADAIDALGRAVTPSVSNTMAIRTQRRRA